MMHRVDISVDFNLRNLSVSFFCDSRSLKNLKKQPNDEVWFVELEDCDLEIVKNKYKDPSLVEVKLKSSRFQVLNQKEEHVEFELRSLKFAVRNTADILVSTISPPYKAKTPMIDDNMTDGASLISYRTTNSSIIKNIPSVPKPQAQTEKAGNLMNNSSDIFSAPQETQGSINTSTEILAQRPLVKAQPETVKKSETMILEARKMRQTARVEPVSTLSRLVAQKPTVQVDYDEPPSDESDLAPANKFLAQKRFERQQLSQDPNTEESSMRDNSNDLDWKPKAHSTAKKVSGKASSASKSKNSKSRVPHKKAESDDEIDEEIINQFGPALNKTDLKPLKRQEAKTSRAPVKKAPKKLTAPKKAPKATIQPKVPTKSKVNQVTVVDCTKFSPPKKAPATTSSKIPSNVVKARRKALSQSVAQQKPIQENDENIPPAEKHNVESGFDSLLKSQNLSILKKSTPELTMKRDKRVSFSSNVNQVGSHSDSDESEKSNEGGMLTFDVSEKNQPDDVDYRSSPPQSRNVHGDIKSGHNKSDSGFHSLPRETKSSNSKKSAVVPLGSLNKKQLRYKDTHEESDLDANDQISDEEDEDLPPQPAPAKRVKLDDSYAGKSRPKEPILEPETSKVVDKSLKPMRQLRDLPVQQNQNLNSREKAAPKQLSMNKPMLQVQQTSSESIQKQSNRKAIQAPNQPQAQQSKSKKAEPKESASKENANKPQEMELSFDMEALKTNQILGKFIDQLSSISPHEVMDDDDDEMNEMIVTTSQTVQTKKLSPTVIRTVQYQEINITPKDPTPKKPEALLEQENFNVLTDIFTKKSEAAFEPLRAELQKLVEFDPPVTAQLVEARNEKLAKALESEKLLSTHADQYTKMLKRLHQYKSKLTQLASQHVEDFSAFEEAQKQCKNAQKKLAKTKLKRLIAIKNLGTEKVKEIKTEAWKDYILSITNQIQNVLQNNFDF